ncbi:hypothetical protein HOH87_03985 [bacterium]|jgi:hypothetical protein|nr:hypothetical protein [bacterium]
MSHGICKCLCHKSVGIGITLIGLTLLLGRFGVLSTDTVSIVWPAILTIIGLKKVCKGFCKCCKTDTPSTGGHTHTHGQGCC